MASRGEQMVSMALKKRKEQILEDVGPSTLTPKNVQIEDTSEIPPDSNMFEEGNKYCFIIIKI